MLSPQMCAPKCLGPPVPSHTEMENEARVWDPEARVHIPAKQVNCVLIPSKVGGSSHNPLLGFRAIHPAQ